MNFDKTQIVAAIARSNPATIFDEFHSDWYSIVIGENGIKKDPFINYIFIWRPAWDQEDKVWGKKSKTE